MMLWFDLWRKPVVPGVGAGEGSDRCGERGSGVVEWLGISALSIGVLVALFAAVESLGLDLIDAIRSQLGV